jgi:hypothetical protein
MPSPTTSWYCDKCRRLIKEADHGWVEWIALAAPDGTPERGRNIRIVHHASHSSRQGGCHYQPDLKGERNKNSIIFLPLTDVQGSDGLMLLFGKIAEQELPTLELLEIIKRIHIPGYERARRHAKDALDAEVFEQRGPDGYWSQSEIQQILDFIAKKRKY